MTVASIFTIRPCRNPTWRAASSRKTLLATPRQASFHDAKIINIDATIIAEQPKITPHLLAMKMNIAQALGINVKKVGIKATTNERLGFIGREEGIAAMAVASVEFPNA